MKFDESLIATHDLGLATALVSSGHPVSDIVRDDYGRAEFLFVKTIAAERAVNDYWADTLEVKARYFFDAIKMLKSRIYSERRP